MSKSVVNFKIDTEVKVEAQQLARELGVPLSVIMNAQLKELLRTRELHLNAQPTITPYLEHILSEVENDRIVGKNVTQTHNLTEALAHLQTL